jgi:hypothetical protein
LVSLLVPLLVVAVQSVEARAAASDRQSVPADLYPVLLNAAAAGPARSESWSTFYNICEQKT